MANEKSKARPAARPAPACATTDPVAVHADEVDAGGLDLAALVHTNAKALCDLRGQPCGCQANLPQGLCIATMQPCRFATEGGSRRPYASEEAGAETP